jgi:hypothetical protein
MTTVRTSFTTLTTTVLFPTSLDDRNSVNPSVLLSSMRRRSPRPGESFERAKPRKTAQSTRLRDEQA